MKEKTIFVNSKSKPISHLPEITFGSMANDGGYFFLNEDDITNNIGAKHFFKQVLGSREFINGINRWCIWLDDSEVENINNYFILNRIESVKKTSFSE